MLIPEILDFVETIATKVRVTIDGSDQDLNVVSVTKTSNQITLFFDIPANVNGAITRHRLLKSDDTVLDDQAISYTKVLADGIQRRAFRYEVNMYTRGDVV